MSAMVVHDVTVHMCINFSNFSNSNSTDSINLVKSHAIFCICQNVH